MSDLFTEADVEAAAEAIAAKRWPDLTWQHIKDHSRPEPFRDEARTALAAVVPQVVARKDAEYAALLERVDFLKAQNQRQASGWAADKVRANAAEARTAAVAAVLDRADAEAICVFNDDVHVETAIVRAALSVDPAANPDSHEWLGMER